MPPRSACAAASRARPPESGACRPGPDCARDSAATRQPQQSAAPTHVISRRLWAPPAHTRTPARTSSSTFSCFRLMRFTSFTCRRTDLRSGPQPAPHHPTHVRHVHPHTHRFVAWRSSSPPPPVPVSTSWSSALAMRLSSFCCCFSKATKSGSNSCSCSSRDTSLGKQSAELRRSRPRGLG